MLSFRSRFQPYLPADHLPVSIYLFKVNIENNRAMSKICSKLKIKTPGDIINVVLLSLLLTLNVFLLLTLKKQMFSGFHLLLYFNPIHHTLNGLT